MYGKSHAFMAILGTPPMPRLPQEIAGPNKALLRETNG